MALFTPESARLAALKSHAPESARNKPPELPQIVPEPPDFVSERLVRVREHITRIDALLTKLLMADKLRAEDADSIRKLSDSLTKLQEQERQLAGRPLPSKAVAGKARRESPAPPRIIETPPNQAVA